MPIYMNYDQFRVKGDATATGHLHWIELVSVMFDQSNRCNSSNCGGGVLTPPPDLVGLYFTKNRDTSSSDLHRESLRYSDVRSSKISVDLHFLVDEKSVNPFAAFTLFGATIAEYATPGMMPWGKGDEGWHLTFRKYAWGPQRPIVWQSNVWDTRR